MIETTRVTFIVNGQTTRLIFLAPVWRLGTMMRWALERSGNTGRPPAHWEIRDHDGVLLDPRYVFDQYFKRAPFKMFVSLGVGAGGCGVAA